MPSRQNTRSDASLNSHRQLQQTDHVGHNRARATDAVRQLLVRYFEFFEQLLIRGSLLEGFN